MTKSSMSPSQTCRRKTRWRKACTHTTSSAYDFLPLVFVLRPRCATDLQESGHKCSCVNACSLRGLLAFSLWADSRRMSMDAPTYSAVEGTTGRRAGTNLCGRCGPLLLGAAAIVVWVVR